MITEVILVYVLLLFPCELPCTTVPMTTTWRPGCDGFCHHDQACDICISDGDGTAQKEALKATFNDGSQVDLILLIDTSVTNNQFGLGEVQIFIESLLMKLTFNYNFEIHPDHVRLAIVKFSGNNRSLSFDGITNRSNAILFSELHDKLYALPSSTEPNGPNKLRDALIYFGANFFAKSGDRPTSKQVLWIFTDANMPEYGLNNALVSSSLLSGLVIFTTAVDQCPSGFFDNLLEEGTLRNISTSPSYFACLELWQKVIRLIQYEKNSKCLV